MRDYIWVARRLSLSDLLDEIVTGTGVSAKEVRGPRRTRQIAHVRQAFMYAARRRTNTSYPQIAAFLNKLDHTCVIHGERVHRSRLDGAGGEQPTPSLAVTEPPELRS